MNSPRTGNWAVVSVGENRVECVMAFCETAAKAQRECYEYEMQSPAHLALDWFVRWEGKPSEFAP